VQDDVERRGRDFQGGGAFFARTLFENPQGERSAVARMQASHELQDALLRQGKVMSLALGGVTPFALTHVDFAL
jgi:hypothetical protein